MRRGNADPVRGARESLPGNVVPWITGGGGYYKRNLLLTQNALVYYPPIYDPWWGWIDGGWGPGEAIVGQRSTSGFGFNVGAGLDFPIEGGASLFFEARYHQAFLDGVDIQIVPVTAGVRCRRGRRVAGGGRFCSAKLDDFSSWIPERDIDSVLPHFHGAGTRYTLGGMPA